jgi:predicted transcriptional regulator
MSHTITVRLDSDLAEWLQKTAGRTGVPQGRIIREQLEKARTNRPSQLFMRLAGSVRGPRDLSARKGFSRS